MALQEDAQVLQSDCEWVHKFKKNKTGEPLDGEAMGAMVKELQQMVQKLEMLRKIVKAGMTKAAD